MDGFLDASLLGSLLHSHMQKIPLNWVYQETKKEKKGKLGRGMCGQDVIKYQVSGFCLCS